MNIRSEADLQRIMMAGVPWQSLHVQQLADAICASLDVVLPWDRAAVDATTEINMAQLLAGTPIGPSDTAIAGHAIAVGAVLVTNNTREFGRVPGLKLEDWLNRQAILKGNKCPLCAKSGHAAICLPCDRICFNPS